MYLITGISQSITHTQSRKCRNCLKKSALVIIDVNDAIANGYVQLATDITDIMEGEADEE